jgi:hypothetical protein
MLQRSRIRLTLYTVRVAMYTVALHRRVQNNPIIDDAIRGEWVSERTAGVPKFFTTSGVATKLNFVGAMTRIASVEMWKTTVGTS